MEYKEGLDKEDKEMYLQLIYLLEDENSFNRVKSECLNNEQFCTQCLQVLYNGSTNRMQYAQDKQNICYILLNIIFTLCKKYGVVELGGMKLDFSISKDEDKCDEFICNLIEYIDKHIEEREDTNG